MSRRNSLRRHISLTKYLAATKCIYNSPWPQLRLLIANIEEVPPRPPSHLHWPSISRTYISSNLNIIKTRNLQRVASRKPAHAACPTVGAACLAQLLSINLQQLLRLPPSPGPTAHLLAGAAGRCTSVFGLQLAEAGMQCGKS